MLQLLLGLDIAAVALCATGSANMWVIVPPSVMLLGFIALLREAAKADAERLGPTAPRKQSKSQRVTSPAAGPTAKRVAPMAADMLAGAARLLPAADRARYAEEYQAELWHLATSGANRQQQLRYALRQFRGALWMRLALQSSQRRSAAP